MRGRNTCILKTLANPMLSGIMMGLQWDEYQLSPVEEQLPCCGGSGYLEDPKHNSQHRCQLRSRIRLTESMLVQYLQTWPKKGGQLPPKIHGEPSSRLLRKLADMIKGYSPQGLVCNGKSGIPSDFWAMALACTWRFGVHAHVVNLNKTKVQHLLPPEEKEGDTLAIFVEQVDRLWDDRQAESLEILVNYAYRSNCFLAIEFCKEDRERVSPDDLSLKAKLGQRLGRLKGRSPYEYLDPDCLSRLKSLCSFPKTINSEGVEHV